MITDRIGGHEVLLPINLNYNKIRDILGFFLMKTKNSEHAHAMANTVQLKE